MRMNYLMDVGYLKRALKLEDEYPCPEALRYIEQLEEELVRAKARNLDIAIDAGEFLKHLHEYQAQAVINDMTESKAVFDMSIAIVEEMVKELSK